MRRTFILASLCLFGCDPGHSIVISELLAERIDDACIARALEGHALVGDVEPANEGASHLRAEIHVEGEPVVFFAHQASSGHQTEFRVYVTWLGRWPSAKTAEEVERQLELIHADVLQHCIAPGR